jgi:hypothetical protein
MCTQHKPQARANKDDTGVTHRIHINYKLGLKKDDSEVHNTKDLY